VRTATRTFGRLLQPRHYPRARATANSGVPWAADNEARVLVDGLLAAGRAADSDGAGGHRPILSRAPAAGCRTTGLLSPPRIVHRTGRRAARSQAPSRRASLRSVPHPAVRRQPRRMQTVADTHHRTRLSALAAQASRLAVYLDQLASELEQLPADDLALLAVPVAHVQQAADRIEDAFQDAEQLGALT
jgi:hypothetical protein